MINPHGADALNPLFVADEARRAQLLESSKALPQVLVSSAAAANAVMLAGGYFTPLNGYMTKQDALEVARTCLLYTSPSPRDLSTSRMPSSA